MTFDSPSFATLYAGTTYERSQAFWRLEQESQGDIRKREDIWVLSKQPTLRQTWDDYFLRWEQAIHTDRLRLDQVWVDIGKEVCAPPSFLWYQDPGEQQAETYLRKPCCLEAYWLWSQHGAVPKSTLRNLYQTALLRDMGGTTILTARKSPTREQGLLYSQFYTSEKEIFDAAKTFPFRDGALESLALDPKIWASWQKAGGSNYHRPETLERSYLGSKARCAAGITGSLQQSFGTREEHRMTLTLALGVRECLRRSGGWDRHIVCENLSCVQACHEYPELNVIQPESILAVTPLHSQHLLNIPSYSRA